MLSEKADTSSFFYIKKGREKKFPGNSCGGLISTAESLSKWNYQLHNEKILSSDLYKIMIDFQIKADFPEGHYGYGLYRY